MTITAISAKYGEIAVIVVVVFQRLMPRLFEL